MKDILNSVMLGRTHILNSYPKQFRQQTHMLVLEDLSALHHLKGKISLLSLSLVDKTALKVVSYSSLNVHVAWNDDTSVTSTLLT